MFNTQTNSRPRLENDTLGNDSLQRLYAIFEQKTIDDGQFKQVCKDVVQNGGGRQAKKDEIIRSIGSATTRQRSLKLAQDFILAGMGLGV